jgi:hypothetical protein
MNMELEVSFLGGTDIVDAVKEANALCIKLGLSYVKFKFNGIRVAVRPHRLLDDDIKGKWHDKIDNKSEHIIF